MFSELSNEGSSPFLRRVGYVPTEIQKAKHVLFQRNSENASGEKRCHQPVLLIRVQTLISRDMWEKEKTLARMLW